MSSQLIKLEYSHSKNKFLNHNHFKKRVYADDGIQGGDGFKDAMKWVRKKLKRAPDNEDEEYDTPPLKGKPHHPDIEPFLETSDNDTVIYKFHKGTPPVVGSKYQGYRQGDRNTTDQKLNSFFGDNSVWGAETINGAKYFGHEALHMERSKSPFTTSIEGHILKLNLGKQNYIRAMKHLQDLDKATTPDEIRKYDPLIRHNSGYKKSPWGDYMTHYTLDINREQLKAYARHIKNEEIVADAGSEYSPSGIIVEQVEPYKADTDNNLFNLARKDMRNRNKDHEKGRKQVGDLYKARLEQPAELT